MPIFDFLSKRMRRLANAGKAEVYQYKELPQTLRVQVSHVLDATIGNGLAKFDDFGDYRGGLWRDIQQIMLREKGLFSLAKKDGSREDCLNYFLSANAVDALDFLEVSFFAVDRVVGTWTPQQRRIAGQTQDAESAIDELNTRLKESLVGFQFEDGELVRVDSQYVHSEAVKPALVLLSVPGFEGPSKEFLKAHEHYRHGRHEEALVDALKAFESTMKVICEARKWKYDPAKATASKLIEIIFTNKLIPEYLQSEFSAFKTTLECGVPTVRNKTAGHGAGSKPRELPGYFASYALHLTAANIVLLVEAHKAMK